MPGVIPLERQTCSRCHGALAPEVPGSLCPSCVGSNLFAEPAAGPEERAASRIGDYELFDELGRGGMGVVYRARQISLNRPAAVKLILTGPLASPVERQRFLAEAEAAAALDHPGIVSIYEAGEENGQPFFAMRLIEGESLAARMRRTKSPLPPREAAQLMFRAAQAVQHAHERGFLHRDLKPGNILLDHAGAPHVTDFGLARRMDSEAHLTLTGSALGTPSYMAPEQTDTRQPPTTAVDVYSLGAILYELLSGHPPFRADSLPELFTAIREHEPASISSVRSEVDRDLDIICRKCLEKEPARRYRSVQALADDIDRWLRGEPIRARPVSSIRRLGKWVRRRPAVASLLGLLLLAALAAAGGITWQWRRAERNAQQVQVRLHQMLLMNVQHSFDEGDPLGALPWLANGLVNEPPGSPRRAVYQLTFASALRAAILPERMWFLPGHASGVQISADGQWLAAYSGNGAVGLWSVATGEPVLPDGTLRGAWATPFSPDSRRLVIGDGHGARLHALPSGREIKFLGHGGPVGHVGFSADSSRVATGGGDSVYVWSAADGSVLTGPLHHKNLVGEVTFAPDGRLLTVDREVAMTLWDVPSGREVRRRSGEMFWRAQFSPNGNLIVASVGREARVYDSATFEPAGGLMPHAGLINQVSFSPDGRRVATASADATARVWDASSGLPVTPPLRHNLEVFAMAFSPDGQSVATGSLDMTARVWDAATGQPLTPWLRHAGLVNGVCFTPDGQRLATGSDDGAVRLWPVRPAEHSLALPGHSSVLRQVWAGDDGKRLLTLDKSGGVIAWLVETGKQPEVALRLQMDVRQAEFSPDGQRVLMDDENTVRIRSLTGSNEVMLRLKSGRSVPLVWSPRGDSFFTARESGRVTEWDAATGALRRELPPGNSLTSNPDVTRDGSILAAADGRAVLIWKLASGECLRSEKLGTSPLDIIRFSPDGQLLAAGAEDGTLGILDTQSAAWISGPLAHPGWILDLDFSPDGRHLAVVAWDGVVRIRDARTGELSGSPLRPPGGANRARFSPDGRFLATASAFAGAVWDVATRGPVTPLFHFPRKVMAGPLFAADSGSVFYVTEDARLSRFRLDAPDWSVEQWQLAARLLSGQTVTESGGLEVWPPGPGMDKAWEQLRQWLRELQEIGAVQSINLRVKSDRAPGR